MGTSSMFDIRGPMMVADSFDPPSARLAIIHKDAGIIADFAREVGTETPLLDAALPLYRRGLEAALGDLDAAALRRLFAPPAPPDARPDAAGSANVTASIPTEGETA